MLISRLNSTNKSNTDLFHNSKVVCKESHLNSNCDYNYLNMPVNHIKAGIHFCSKERLNKEKLQNLNIPNIHVINGECVRGESLSSPKNRRFISAVKKYGIENIMDLREKYSSALYEDLCKEQGLNYYNIPVDSSSVEDSIIINNFPTLFKLLDNGKTYIACAQGLHRTDIALALNYIFNPKEQSEPPIMYGHFRDYGFKRDDIARRVNSIKKTISEDDLIKLGWDRDNFEQQFGIRKKELFQFNDNIANGEL